MSSTHDPIQCIRHGVSDATFMCHHLHHGVACGFHQADSDDPWPDAWCDACHDRFERSGGWTHDNEPQISAVCRHCYEECRQRNETVQRVRRGELAMPPRRYEKLLATASEWSIARQERAKATYGIDARPAWFYDGERRVMRFYDPAGTTGGVLADVDIVGTFSVKTSTFMWRWANDGASDEERARMSPVRVFGEVRGFSRLTEECWEGTQLDAWDVTRIAAYLLGAEGLYRAPSDNLYLFMVLRRFRLES